MLPVLLPHTAPAIDAALSHTVEKSPFTTARQCYVRSKSAPLYDPFTRVCISPGAYLNIHIVFSVQCMQVPDMRIERDALFHVDISR